MVSAHLAHKARQEFVLLAETCDPDVFVLAVDHAVEDRLCDHQTGVHVAGMVLVEAARQAAAVALERTYPELSESHAAVLSSVHIVFNGYVFAERQTQLHVAVAVRDNSARRVDADVSVRVMQDARDAASVVLDISLLPRAVLRRAERNALACVRRSLCD